MTRRAVLVVLVIGLSLVAISAAIVLAHKERHLSGTNSVRAAEYVVDVLPRETLCQSGELFPADTARLQVYVGSYGRRVGPLQITIQRNGLTRVRTSVPAGFPDGDLAVPTRVRGTSLAQAKVCIHNQGVARIALAGTRPSDGAATVQGEPIGARVRIEYLRGGLEQWWQLVPEIVARAGVSRAAFVGKGSLLIAFILAVAAWVLAVRILLGEVDPE